jgi:hypothetical protein
MEIFNMGRGTLTSMAILKTWSLVARCRRCQSPWSRGWARGGRASPVCYLWAIPHRLLIEREEVRPVREHIRGREGEARMDTCWLLASAAVRSTARRSDGTILLHLQLQRLGLGNPNG